MFEGCGLGKTLQQLVIAHEISRHCNAPFLLVAPLAVAEQTVDESAKFNLPPVKRVYESSDVTGPGVYIVNYDRVDKLEAIEFCGVGLDESSILKSFNGTTRRYLTDRFSKTPYRFAFTATPAPNDFTELGQHAEFLGVCTPAQMLATYFINDTANTGEWRIKKHAVESFWKWVSSWAVCISKPSDIGFSDEGYDLPALNLNPVWVETQGVAPDGELFQVASALSATQVNGEMRKSIQERAQKVAEIVRNTTHQVAIWVNLNDEQDAIELALGNECVSVRGGDTEKNKIAREKSWRNGEVKCMVSKGSIFGYGMNWQHCHEVIYFPDYSFEDFYQVIRRFWRFGQVNEVNCSLVLPTTASKILEVLKTKQGKHDVMRDLVKFTAENLHETKSDNTKMNTKIKTTTGTDYEIHNGDCVRVMREKVKDESIGFSVFSPPFSSLFTYSDDIQDMGNCDGVSQFMEQFGFCIDELTRITMPGRECAVHCCDLLATKWKDGAIEFQNFSGKIAEAFRSRGWLFHSRITIWKSPVTEMQRTKAHGLLYKTLRKDSASSRVGAPDYLLVFRKRGENPKPIEHTPDDFTLDEWQEIASPVWMTIDQGNVLIYEIARDNLDERHICPLQLDVINRALKLWSAPGDTVLSPFMGIGSEGYCALKMGRKFIGAELKPSYFELAHTHLEKALTDRVTLFDK